MFTRSASLIAVSVILGVLATVAVALRFTARYIKGLRIWIDDHLVLVALVLAWGVCICNIAGASVARFGNHEIYQTSGPDAGRPLPELLILYGKICFACRLLHSTAMQLLKIALLVFYRRIFAHNRNFNAVFWAMIGYVTLWWLVCFWLNVFTCYPIYWTWSPSKEMPQHCIPNYHAFFSYASLTNLLSDVLITIVPFPFLFVVRMNIMKKLAISGMLLTAAVVIIAGIGRTYAFFTVGHSPDYTYENYDYLIWSSVEPCVGVIGCCLPTLRPLFTDNSDTAFSRSYTPYAWSSGRCEPRAPRPMGSMDQPLSDQSSMEKGSISRPQGTFLSEDASSSDSHEMSNYSGNPRALFYATPRLDAPTPSGDPLNQHPMGAFIVPPRREGDSIGAAY